MHLHQNNPEHHCRPWSVVRLSARLSARLSVRLAVQLALAVVVSVLVMSPRVLVAQTGPVSQESAPPESTQPESTQPASTQPESTESTEQESTTKQTADDDAFFGASHRRQMYEESKLSTTRAVLYNLALPGLGNIYAEQYFYGGIAFSLMVFTLVFVGYGLVTDQPDFLWIGGGTAAIAYAGSIATSIQGVRDYNDKLRQGLKLEGAFSQAPLSAGRWALPRAMTVDVGIRF